MTGFCAGLWPKCVHGVSTDAHRHDRVGATLTTVAGTANAQSIRETNVEIVALRLFRDADRAGVLITRRHIESKLTELRSHPNDCRRCSRLCQLARKVNSASVFRCAAAWQVQINTTRRLAGR
jgi:hypothetical protein